MKGQTIEHYKISEKIGQGGMGEVYRATDTKLNREVAIKVLPNLLAEDPDRMARFSREAQVLASLNHPNIAAIHGLEESGGKRALVMELVDGETLAERIQRGPIPLEEALAIAKQIAQALEEAHEHGFIHRDLKPANVKITPKGTVKVLDFGLAKALEGESSASSPDLSQSPTLSAAATAAGIIMGTAAYMSPEQARGKKVDRRGDIWSFGIVLLEMLTGRAVYTGDTVSDVLARVLEREPDWESVPQGTPPSIKRLLRRCATKDVTRRLQAIGDARLTIEEYLEDPSAAEEVATVSSVAEPSWRRAAPWVVAGVLGVGFLATLFWPFGTPVAATPMRLDVKVSPGNLFTNIGPAAVLSPDGTRLAYVSGGGAERRLYIRSLDQLEGVVLSGTEEAYNPFFSPDGRWIGFVTPTNLKKVSVTGGAPLTLGEANLSRGASWGSDDTIVFAASSSSGLSLVPAVGGTPQELTTLDESKGEVTHRWPHVLPGGRAALFTSHTAPSDFDNANIEVVILATGERKLLHQGGSYARYLASGHIVYLREGTIFAAPFDANRLEMTGSPAPVLEGVMANSDSNGGAQYSFSESGTFVYLTGTAEGPKYQLVWVDRRGIAEPLSEEEYEYDSPRFSADGRQLVVDIGTGADADVWVYDLDRGVSSRLTFGESADAGPFWSPDGEYVGFSSNRHGGPVNLYWKRADGSGDVRRLTESDNFQSSVSVSPDGKYVIYHEANSETNFDLWLLPLEGDGEPELYLRTPFREDEAEFSPNGRWVAYHSNETGQSEVFVRPFPEAPGKWQVSTGGGAYPRWSKDGQELFYRTDTGLMVVNVDTQAESFRADKPQQLFEGNFVRLPFAVDYDVHPDGKRFVMLRSEDAQDTVQFTHLTMVTNWFEELHNTFVGAN